MNHMFCPKMRFCMNHLVAYQVDTRPYRCNPGNVCVIPTLKNCMARRQPKNLCAPKWPSPASEVRAAPRQRHIPTMLFSTPCASALWGPYLRCPPPAHLGVEGSWDLKKRAVLWVSETWHPQNMFTWIATISNWITCEWWQSAQVNGAHDWGTNRNHGGWSPPTQFLIQKLLWTYGAYGCIWDIYDKPRDFAAEKAAKGAYGCSVCNLSLRLPWFFLKNRDVRQDCKQSEFLTRNNPSWHIEGCHHYWGVISAAIFPSFCCPFQQPCSGMKSLNGEGHSSW